SKSLFGKIRPVLTEQGDIRDICETLSRGYSPLAVSGLSSVHKSQLAMLISDRLYGEKNVPLLLIADDEAGAKKICDDINELYGDTFAYVYPAKDITLARVDSVSREYEHRRLGVLTRILDGSCRIVCASAEAVMQKTVTPKALSDNTIVLSRDNPVDLPALTQRLVRAGYTRCDKVESPSQFSVRGSIADIFPVQEKAPVRMELWDDEIDAFSYFDPETQRRTDSIDRLIIPPASEVLFDSPEELAERINKLASSVRGKRAETVRANLAKDADAALNGLTLANIDKYITIAYEKPALIFDYLKKESCVLFSEYHGCCERAKGIVSQHGEDIKILLEEGELCRGLEGYMEGFEVISERAQEFPCVLMDSFLRTNDLRCKKLLSLTAYQTAPWGGEIRQLTEDLRSLINRNYSVVVLAGSEKTLPIIADDLREEGIPCDIMDKDSVLTKGRALLTTGCLSSGYDYPDIKTALITQARAMTSKRKLRKKKKGEEIKSLADITPGDLVVHALHGIGRFEGIR
ncbi:MAG: CarD family transcriptional regulator, partial [Huintestinicola sp.]